jgi:hypothetical protein
MTTTLPTTPPLLLAGAATIAELGRLEIALGHDLRTEEMLSGAVQHWSCARAGCTAVLERRLGDGAVSGSARDRRCPRPAPGR